MNPSQLRKVQGERKMHAALRIAVLAAAVCCVLAEKGDLYGKDGKDKNSFVEQVRVLAVGQRRTLHRISFDLCTQPSARRRVRVPLRFWPVAEQHKQDGQNVPHLCCGTCCTSCASPWMGGMPSARQSCSECWSIFHHVRLSQRRASGGCFKLSRLKHICIGLIDCIALISVSVCFSAMV